MNRMKSETELPEKLYPDTKSKFLVLFLLLNIVLSPIIMFSLVVATERYHAFGTIILTLLICLDLFGVCYQLVTGKR